MAQDLSSYFPTAEADIPEAHRLGAPLHQRQILINGKLIDWAGPTQDVFSPIAYKNGTDGNGEPQRILVGSYPLGTEVEAMQALDAAVQAYDNGRGEWPSMSVDGRIAAMEEFTRQMVARKEQIVRLIVYEIGKTVADATKEFDRTVTYIHDTLDEIKRLDREGSRFQIMEGVIAQVRRAPLGVVLCMGPFNYPLNETFALLIPALAMGNTVCFKPPKHGTLLHYPLLECFVDAFPAGVVNTVYGRGADVVPGLMQTGKINVLGLIGSSNVADKLKKKHPKSNRLRAILSLAAKNMAIVLPDADLDATVKECILGALSYNGQRCTALKIFFVHRSIAEQFVQKLSDGVDALKLGMPYAEKVDITPLPEPNKPGYLKELIDDAIAHGASIRNEDGGATLGPLVKPVVLYPVAKGSRAYTEEQFGPLLPVVPYDDIEEALTYQEESDHGQQVSVFGKSPEAIAQVLDPLANLVCRVNVNAQCQRGPDFFPFTGRKDSAEGTLSVPDAVRSFSIRTMVATKDTPANKQIVNAIVDSHESEFLSTRFLL